MTSPHESDSIEISVPKKVGILNFQYSNHNFGAVLQAAALSHCIAKLGHNAEHLNYIPEFKKVGILRHIAGTILRKLGLRHVKSRPKGSEVFEQFRAKWLPRSALCHTESELIALSRNYQALVVGSDQVWRPNYTIGDPLVFFLGFAQEECSRIAYAASFGVDHWVSPGASFDDKVRSLLAKFDSISCREDSGVEICQKLFGVEATHVLDPTLLVGREFFDTVIDAANLECHPSEIVYYKLDAGSEFNGELENIRIKHEVVAENIYFKTKAHQIIYLRVEEWLFKIRHCDFIVTDSYHCICFAILFEKQFLYIRNDDRGFSRIESLLNIFGISGRVCKEREFSMKYQQLLTSPIDYNEISPIMSTWRGNSRRFLEMALNAQVN